MEVKGLEGLTPADIRTELDNGARFVAYSWCVSLLVVTLKRSSDVYFVRPGRSSFAVNFGCSLLTVLLGWWGFPWGPIYSIAALFTNLRGGTDLTDEIARQLLEQNGLTYSPATLRRSESGAWMAPLAALASAGALVLGGFWVNAYVEGRDMPVALVNGLDVPYDVTVDGVSRTLAPHSSTRVLRPEGRIEVSARLPGGIGESAFTVDASSHIDSVFQRQAVFINPDAAAPVIVDTIYYGFQQASAPPPRRQFHAGTQHHVIPRPDYFLTEFPGKIESSSSTGYRERSRAYALDRYNLTETAAILQKEVSHETMLAYIQEQGRLRPNDEFVLRMAARFLDKENTRTFFLQHLKTRPVIVEWHRYFQQLATYYLPDFDLVAYYREAVAAEPEDGALAYLLGRALDDPEQSPPWFERALTAPRPCEYARVSRAWALLGRGEWTAALAELDHLRAAGIDYSGALGIRIDSLLALKRYDDALHEHQALANRNDSKYEHAQMTVALTMLARGRAAARAVVDDWLGSLPPEYTPESRDYFRRGMEAVLEYAAGNHAALATLDTPDNAPAIRLPAAICAGDLERAEACFAEFPVRPAYWWMINYLSARQSDPQRAERYWKEAVKQLANEGATERRMAAWLQTDAAARAEPNRLLHDSMSFAEQRVFFAAIAAHEPAHRAAFLARAAQCNIEPTFPFHLIAEVTKKFGP